MTYEAILAERRGPAAWITLNRPERRNALGPTILAELHDALGAAREDGAARVVVLTGAGKGFSAGGDLAGFVGGSTLPPRSFPDVVRALRTLGKPSIARVHGAAMGGGLGLAAACDVVLADEDAKLGTPEIDHGLFPMMIMPILLRGAPRRKVLEMMLTGARIDGRTAEAWGIVTRAVPAGRLDEEVDRAVAALSAKSPAAMRIGLEAFHAQTDMDEADALPYLEGMLAKVIATEDAQEGIRAFLEKRDPVWKGR